MLQITGAIPYFLIFLKPYRRWMNAKFNLIWCLMFTLPVLIYSFNGFTIFLAYTGIIWLVLQISPRRLSEIILFFLIWLPVEFNILPMTNLNSGSFIGYFIVLSIFSHILQFRIRPGGLDFSIFPVRFKLVLVLYILLFIIIVPAGYLMHFLKFSPGVTPMKIISFIPIYFFVAYPEEMLFRAYFFKILGNLNVTWKIFISSLLFGIAHFNGPHGGFAYMVLATIAGAGYAFTFWGSGNVNSSALLHALVDYTWVLFFGG